MKLQTIISDEPCKVRISYDNSIMMLGSCFSDNIGNQLRDFGFDVNVNPFGTLYNPVSILQSVKRLAMSRPFTEEDCTDMGAGSGLTCSFSHHTSFARKDRQAFLDNANKALEEAAGFFRKSDRLVITLGTSWCFRHMEKDMIVSNCLKKPAQEFVRERLTPEEVAAALTEIMDLCSDGSSGRKKDIIFTVSPIRHFKDGAHGNQLSKATLLLGIDEALKNQNPETASDYFPAYEIVMDELRDYRFYAEDMLHPSSVAVDYIRERFLDWSLQKEERPKLEENIRNYRRSCHRPLNAE